MAWDKVLLVLRREYIFNFKRPSFLFTAFGVPLLTLVALFVVFQFVLNRESSLDGWERVAYVDLAGVLDPAGPNPDAYRLLENEQIARQQLVDGNLDAYLVVTEGYVFTGQVDLYTRKNPPQALHDAINEFMRAQIAAKVPADLPVPTTRLEETEFTMRDPDTGEEISDAAMIGRFMLPFLFVFLYFMATNTTAQFMMSGVVEEKENRLMEILATSLRPLELLWGKLLGLGALALTQVALWSAAGVGVALINQDARDFLSGAEFQLGDVALILVLFVINFMLFSAMMLGIGASVTAEAESRQVAGIFTFINVIPLALLGAFFTNPNGPLPMFFSFFPLTAAMGLILRLGLTSVPLWQTALSLVIQVASVAGVMWLAAKVFRLGMLMYGKPLTPRVLWSALREGRTVLTTASDYDQPRPVKKKKGWLFR